MRVELVEAHYSEIRTVVRSVASRLCRDRGWDLDDLTSEVVLAIARRQDSERSRFDPRRSTLDYYLRLVTRSVVSDWLKRDKPDTLPLEHEHDDTVGPDEVGLDDAQAARLDAILADTRRVLSDGIAYRAVVVWLLAGEDAMASVSGIKRLDLLRYIAKMLARLARQALPRWRPVWRPHLSRAYRQIASERARVAGIPPPLMGAKGPRVKESCKPFANVFRDKIPKSRKLEKPGPRAR